MEYSIGKLAKLSGISSRTLRYYDETGLLKPARINSSGYRIYGQKEVDVLQQILFYRELEVSLDDILAIMNKPDFSPEKELQHHHSQLLAKRERLNRLIETVEETMESIKGGLHMPDEKKFQAFKEKMIEENRQKYGVELEEKYGSELVDNSNTKLINISQEEYNAMTSLEKEIFDLLKKAYATKDPASKEAQALADSHRRWLEYTWSSYSKEAHLGLAEMYVADPRFTAYYDKVVPGGAAFLLEAIKVYTDNR